MLENPLNADSSQQNRFGAKSWSTKKILYKLLEFERKLSKKISGTVCSLFWPLNLVKPVACNHNWLTGRILNLRDPHRAMESLAFWSNRGSVPYRMASLSRKSRFTQIFKVFVPPKNQWFLFLSTRVMSRLVMTKSSQAIIADNATRGQVKLPRLTCIV